MAQPAEPEWFGLRAQSYPDMRPSGFAARDGPPIDPADNEGNWSKRARPGMPGHRRRPAQRFGSPTTLRQPVTEKG